MSFSPDERTKILSAHSIGPKMVQYLEAAGYTSLNEFCDADASTVLLRVEAETGVRLNTMGFAAVENLIALAIEMHTRRDRQPIP